MAGKTNILVYAHWIRMAKPKRIGIPGSFAKT